MPVCFFSEIFRIKLLGSGPVCLQCPVVIGPSAEGSPASTPALWTLICYKGIQGTPSSAGLGALFRLFPSASLLVAHLGLNPDPNPNPNP